MTNAATACPVRSPARRAFDAVARYFGLERQLALINVAVPGVLAIADGRIRESVSAYHDMAEPQFYFVPITAAAVLFAANGLIKERNLFNVVLGAVLAGVLFFNLDAYGPLHNVLAIAFFGGNIMMILLTSSRTWYRALTGIGAALAVLYMWQAGDGSTFYAEWVLLAFISGHFVIESLDGKG